MSNFSNLNQYILPTDILMDMLNTYKYLGCNKIYKEKLSNNYDVILGQTLERDTYFLALIMGIDITDTRMRLLITKNSTPRTKDEQVVSKLKDVLFTIRKSAKLYSFNSSDLLSMINTIYGKNYATFKPDVIKGDRKKQIASRSLRHLFDATIDEYNLYFEKNKYEHIFLSLMNYVEITNLNAFTAGNKLISLLALYYMILRSDVDCFLYVSFFEIFHDYEKEFNQERINASINYHEGYIQLFGLTRLTFKIIEEGYKKLDQITKEYFYEEKFNKSDNVENTIRKLPSIFTKDDIRAVHPYVSEATINRVLNKLKDDDYIRPLSKGRSARWIKTNTKKEFIDNIVD